MGGLIALDIHMRRHHRIGCPRFHEKRDGKRKLALIARRKSRGKCSKKS